jgi:predicted unusual protein kinase regulating ubiquinone biosynthesis (AarF/ABC1/UbiB family)
MAKKWEEVAGDSGKDAPKGRLSRFMKMGGLGLSVGAGTVARKVANKVLPGSEEAKKKAESKANKKQAEKIVKTLGQLKGASMKIGQILSADPDLIPPEYVDTLTALQSNAPPMTYQTLRDQIEAAFDRPIETIFQHFDPDPIGSASIGQVHKATLMDGQEVCLKIQYPGILESMESDMKNLSSLMILGRTLVHKDRLNAYLEECRRAILEEADYELEASKLERFHKIFADREGMRAPKPYPEWTRKTVLTMEYVEGTKLDEALLHAEKERRTELACRYVANYVWMFHELFELHSDPHPGNFLIDGNDNLVMLDFGCVKAFDPKFSDGILDVLVGHWRDDPEMCADVYRDLGFGREDTSKSVFDARVIEKINEISLAPFLYDEEFDFSAWRPRVELQKLILKHPKVLKFTPPAEALLYFRVVSGIKGLLARLNVQANVYDLAVDTAIRRGRIKRRPRSRSRD